MFMRLLALSEPDDDHRRHLHRSSGRDDTGQNTIDHRGVGKAEQHFVDDLVFADRPADRRDGGVGEITADEMIFVEAFQLVMADTPGQGWDVVNTGVGNRGRMDIPDLNPNRV